EGEIVILRKVVRALRVKLVEHPNDRTCGVEIGVDRSVVAAKLSAVKESVERKRVARSKPILGADVATSRQRRLFASENRLAVHRNRNNEVGARDQSRGLATIVIHVPRHEHSELALLLADVAVRIHLAGRRRTGRQSAAQAELRFLIQQNV